MAGEMTKCMKCQKDLSMFTSVCPGCGARRRPPQWAIASFVVLGVFAVILVIGAVTKKEKHAEVVVAASAPAPQPPKTEAKPAIPVEVTAGELYEAYRANEIGADAKYKDKVLRVAGVVDRVGKGADEKPFVVFMVLEAGDDGLRARFGTATGLAELKRFQSVAVRCRGGNSQGQPTLSECVFERVIDEEPATSSDGSGRPRR